MKKGFRTLFFLIGVCGVLLLLKGANLNGQDWKSLLRPELFLQLGAQLLLWVGIFIIHTGIYLFIIGPESKRVGFLRMFKICVAGVALNNVTPAGLFGGEPYRILELRRFMSSEKAVSSTLTFSLLYALGHSMLWGTAAVIYVAFGCPGSLGVSLMMILGGTLSILFCVYFFAKKKGGLVLPFLHFFAKIPFLTKFIQKRIEKNEQLFENIDAGISSFRETPKRFRKAVLLEFAARLVEAAEYWGIMRYFGLQANFFEALLVMGTASLVGNLLFLIPLQAGTREGGTCLAMLWVGGSEAIGMLTGLLFRLRELITTAIGILMILVEKKTLQEFEKVDE